MISQEDSVLIVEDDKNYVDLYKRILQKEYNITIARTIATAIELITNMSFAVILVDLKMPGLSGSEYGGLDFIPKVNMMHPYTEIIVITAYGTLEHALKAGRGGVSAFIEKPINIDELKDVIKRGVISYEQKRRLQPPVRIREPLKDVEQILECFPTCAQHLATRRRGRPAFVLENEYDVQDLLYVMLKPLFSDLECEEHTPKLAGSEKRVDFVLKEAGIVLEVKCMREKNHAKSVFDELKIDIESYYTHRYCNTLIFFIYDPRFEIEDAHRKMQDLSGNRNIKGREMQVKLIIRPC